MTDPPVSFTSFTFGYRPEVNEIIARRRQWQHCSFTSFCGEGHVACAPAQARMTLPYLQNEVNEVNEKGVSRRRGAKISFTSPPIGEVNGSERGGLRVL